MDPNELLASIRQNIADFHTAREEEMYEAADDFALSAIGGVEALDEWMSKGGHGPAAWIG